MLRNSAPYSYGDGVRIREQGLWCQSHVKGVLKVERTSSSASYNEVAS